MVRRSLVGSYLLWGFFGVLGAHRFYLGDYGLGLIYFFTGGLFGIGWFVDAFLIPGRVDEVNRRIEEREHRQLAPARAVALPRPKKRKPKRESKAERRLRQEQAILAAARKGDGTITAAEAALAASMTVQDADAWLGEQAKQGFCDIENRDAGTVCYRFFGG